MFSKVLIANRGEIALRILRACRELGIQTVAVHSVADREQIHVRLADESVCIGPSDPRQSYLHYPAIISAAEVTNADAIHPGYGFLAENAEFAECVETSGFVFIGPKAETIRQMGDKITAITLMKEFGVPCVPGSDGPIDDDPAAVRKIAGNIGYPVLVKATGGGGGRGMRIVHREEDLESAIATTKSEALASFGNDVVYLEKYLEKPRHIEFQIIGGIVHCPAYPNAQGAHGFPLLVGDTGRRCLLDQFLVTTLNGAIPLPQVNRKNSSPPQAG